MKYLILMFIPVTIGNVSSYSAAANEYWGLVDAEFGKVMKPESR